MVPKHICLHLLFVLELPCPIYSEEEGSAAQIDSQRPSTDPGGRTGLGVLTGPATRGAL